MSRPLTSTQAHLLRLLDSPAVEAIVPRHYPKRCTHLIRVKRSLSSTTLGLFPVSALRGLRKRGLVVVYRSFDGYDRYVLHSWEKFHSSPLDIDGLMQRGADYHRARLQSIAPATDMAAADALATRLSSAASIAMADAYAILLEALYMGRTLEQIGAALRSYIPASAILQRNFRVYLSDYAKTLPFNPPQP